MNRSDLADYLGLTPETVSRVLRHLREDGAIELPSVNRVLVLDRARLEEMAESGF
jgi:CRP-like cAMP-binding protein